ncbi:hypothetical protein D3C78_1357990 [compost metagenome]
MLTVLLLSSMRSAISLLERPEARYCRTISSWLDKRPTSSASLWAGAWPLTSEPLGNRVKPALMALIAVTRFSRSSSLLTKPFAPAWKQRWE